MEKRYQVFVSSTFQDLEGERQEVMHALLELDCIPSGMELFPAANESQWNLIKKVIQDCDYYILILGGRYGSIGPDGLSYTEMEYRYAMEIEKPIISFLHRDPGSIAANKTELSEDGKIKLQKFRSLVQNRICKMWSNPPELGSVVSRSLIQLIKSNPAVGWVRANELADREATLELLQLRRQIDELQEELNKIRTSAPKEASGLAQGDETHVIQFTFKAKLEEEVWSQNWKSKCEFSWNEIFGYIAPIMMNEVSEKSIISSINNLIELKNAERLSNNKKIGRIIIGSFNINDEDFQTIKVQLRALGLIVKSDKNRSVKDSDNYWTLTPFGDESMIRLRAIRKNSEPASVENGEPEAEDD
ncbi:DUF4062 domain-containing protein [Xanthobacter flavus]|uniref:DUF4062 domain-containing protein n=1 Tax=Xanthobacter flavus TaxID=281 RepID=UPI00372C3E21